MAYSVPPSEKVGGHFPRVPHQIAPMIVTDLVIATGPALCGAPRSFVLSFFYYIYISI